MAIRFKLVDRATGQAITVDAPARGEYVKDGKRVALPPKETDVESLTAAVRVITKLGATGGCLHG